MSKKRVNFKDKLLRIVDNSEKWKQIRGKSKFQYQSNQIINCHIM